jgi:hypothetical protein
VPAAAVIPAPIAYIKVVAVKKLVVEFRAWLWTWSLPHGGVLSFLSGLYLLGNHMPLNGCFGDPGLLL